MTRHSATRIVAAIILVAGLAVAPLLHKDEPSDSSTSLPTRSPQFEISWRPGELALSGHTTSLKHEQELLQVANTSYAEYPVRIDFQPLGIVPVYWGDTTIQVLYLLAETVSANAELSADRITIRGITVDELGWKNRLDALKTVLPSHVSIDVDIFFIDPTVSVLDVCKRAFTTLETGPINFRESSAQFRSSAYPRLDRVIALANACGDSEISITGYTDSSGNESSNQRLSLKRANAVGDYIVAGGVDRVRLSIAGAGSTAPVATDNTRYGRSLNRRIEIVLSSAD